MSKVISFSISDRYLDKLRTLYPALTDNLAVKQFVTDGLESSLGNSLDDRLDDGLDGKLKSLIESELDDLLEGRLDATVGKLLTSLSDRLSRLEERLDDSLDDGLDDRVLTLVDSRLNESIARLGSNLSQRLLALEKKLDDMERLLKLQREASIAAPIPTGEPSPLPPSLPPDEPDRPAIKTVTPEVSPSPPDAIASIDGNFESVEPISAINKPVKEAIENSEKKITLLDTSIGSQIGIDKSGSEPGTDAIATLGMTAMAAVDYLKAKKVKVSYDSLNRWINRKKIPDSPQGKDARKHLILRDGLYFPTTD